MHYHRWRKHGDPTYQWAVAGRTCVIDDCDRPVKSKNMCNPHYLRVRRYGDPNHNGRIAPPTCEVDGCEKPRSGRLCAMHRRRLYVHGDVNYKLTTEDKFWAKVDKNGPVSERRPDLGRCWLWNGTLQEGYGYFRWPEGKYAAYRYTYTILVAPIPDGYEIDHLCKVTQCVNPGHLEAVTRNENYERSDSIARINREKTHCKRGHPLSGDNLYVLPSTGGRTCRACVALNRRRRREESGSMR